MRRFPADLPRKARPDPDPRMAFLGPDNAGYRGPGGGNGGLLWAFPLPTSVTVDYLVLAVRHSVISE